MASTAYFLLIVVWLFCNVGSKGPDIKAYMLFTNDTGHGFAHQAFIILLLIFKQYLPIELFMTLLGPLLIFTFKFRKFTDLVFAILAILLIFHFSYSANSLLGNILRQGVGTVIFIILFYIFSRRRWLAVTSVFFHQALLVVYFLQSMMNSKFRNIIGNKYRIVFFAICCVSFLLVFEDRVVTLFGRVTFDDLPGFLAVYLLFIVRLFLFYTLSHRNLTNWLVVVFSLLAGLLFGEFAQRILISLIFIIDIFYASLNHHKKCFYKNYIPILSLETILRYYFVGNFWGVISKFA